MTELIDRKSWIGSSDAASILGVSPWKSQFALYQEKIGEFHEEITPEKQKIFNRGKKFEPLILEMLLEELGDRGHDVEVITRNERLRDPELPFLASESDMVLRIDGEVLSAEAKSVNGFAAKLWGEPETDDFPVYYQCQTMHDLMVKRRNKCVVAALIGTDDLRIHWIERNEEIIQAIRAKEVEFWDRVQRRDPPELSEPEDIKRVYQIDSGAVLEADNELLELIGEASNKKTELKAAETRLDVLTTMIKKRMGEAAVLMHNGTKLATWKTNKDSVKTDWKEAFFALVLESKGLGKADIDLIIKKFTETKTGARPFSIK
ncbi:lambda-exonuclease family protein [Nitrosomonas sp.]|uniref:YqaJ viral recombinase family nuclease n=1 Tax=Nitrosomonas sp. TaxID=42353 RepID=UPI0025D505A9|nr:YqaJ viral recombinase family protein [Nitrosomonas sp.]MBY0483467.1 YqaJ viral recombinase family protein [Nitrosomonas sp.]